MRIVIVDDDEAMRGTLRGYCERYAEENALTMSIREYGSGDELLSAYQRGDADLIFFDVEMPGTDGLETARRIRRLDDVVTMLFVTNMAQYAINGCEVNAVDYVLKPLSYFDCALKLTKAMRAMSGRSDAIVTIDSIDGLRSVAVGDMYFIEVFDHYLWFHTAAGVYKARGSISSQANELHDYGFARIHKSFLVNLRHVSNLTANTVTCNGKELPIGRAYKNALTQDYLAFLGGRR